MSQSVFRIWLIIYLKIIRMISTTWNRNKSYCPKISRKENFSNNCNNTLVIIIVMGHCKYSRPTLVGPCEDSWAPSYITTLKTGKRNKICIGKVRKVRRQPGRQSGRQSGWSVTNGRFLNAGAEHGFRLRRFLFFSLLFEQNTVVNEKNNI